MTETTRTETEMSNLETVTDNLDMPPPSALTSDQALARLMDGNKRFSADAPEAKRFSAERAAQAVRQQPFAAVLACADSRIPPELAFDQGPGRIFTIRLAGNFLNTDGLASLEYATGVLDVPLILVLGHTSCGAVDAAIQAEEENAAALPGCLPALVDSIAPAVAAAKALAPENLLGETIRQNVKIACARIKNATPLIAEKVKAGEVRIVGGVYDLASGEVELLAD